VIVATGFDNDSLGGPTVIKNDSDEDARIVEEPTPEPTTIDVEGEKQPTPAPKPVVPYRSAPVPIVRPSRNFAEIEECKRTPSYLTHGIQLSTAVKAHPIAGAEVEQSEDDGAKMQALF
jgi:hypothetical protein